MTLKAAQSGIATDWTQYLAVARTRVKYRAHGGSP